MDMDMEINLTIQERLDLYNQYTILQKLSQIQGDEHEAEFYGLRAKIVSEGYLYDYYMLTECIADNFSLEDAKLVWDTLDMYSAIYYSYSRLENPKLTSEQIHFEGFDGNYETRSMVYCRFIINELERYTEFKENGYNIICADERTDNVLGECPLHFPILLVVGGEKRGISRSLLNIADMLIKIPYGREFKASLSAASATTMFAYEIMRQNKNT